MNVWLLVACATLIGGAWTATAPKYACLNHFTGVRCALDRPGVDFAKLQDYASDLIPAKRLDEAVTCFQLLARQLPDNCMVWSNLAIVARNAGLHALELDCAREAVRLESAKADFETVSGYCAAVVRSETYLKPAVRWARLREAVSHLESLVPYFPEESSILKYCANFAVELALNGTPESQRGQYAAKARSALDRVSKMALSKQGRDEVARLLFRLAVLPGAPQ